MLQVLKTLPRRWSSSCAYLRSVTSILHKINKHQPNRYSSWIRVNHTVQWLLTSLIYTKIKVEEPYKSRIIIEFINYQEYGHTISYCGYPARYVHCGALHSSWAFLNSRHVTLICASAPMITLQIIKAALYKIISYINHKKNVYVILPVLTPSTHLADAFQTYAQATFDSHSNNMIPFPVSDTKKFHDGFNLKIIPLIALLIQVISKVIDKK
jgi:hypothetical protein